MNPPEVSIIMPVYNADRFLSEALDSVLNQTFQNFELICVNDGSTDSSLDILERYKINDDRVIIIDQANKGGTKAREAGYRYSRAEYLWFIDSDDVIPKNGLLALYTALIDNNADIAIGRFRVINNNSITDVVSHEIGPEKNGISFDQFLNLNSPQLWNKIFKRRLFNAVDFTPVKIGQDLALSHQAAIYSSKSILTEEDVYHYRVYHGSITQTYSVTALLDITRSLDIIIAHAKKEQAYQVNVTSWKKLQLKHCLHQLKKVYFLPFQDARSLQKGIRTYLAKNVVSNLSPSNAQLEKDVQLFTSLKVFVTPGYIKHHFLYCFKNFLHKIRCKQ